MASTYSPSLKLELIGNGDQSGTWGTTTNNNLGTLLEQAITGVQSITMVNANYTLTNYNGTSDEARNAILVLGGTNSAIRQVICPLVNKTYIIKNATSGGFAITVGGVTGATVTIPNQITAQIYCDGTAFYSSQTGSAGDFTVNGTFYAQGAESVTGNLTVGGTLGVTGATTFTGIPSGPTATAGTNTTQLATTAFVSAATSGLGTMAQQNANNVAITGGTINGVTGTNSGMTVGTATNATNVTGTVGTANGGTGLTSAGASGHLLVSNGSTWTSATLASSGVKLGLGITGEVWNNLTGTRAANTTYTNSYSYPIMVTIQLHSGSSGTNPSYLYVGGVAVAAVSGGGWTGGMDAPGTAIVPPGVTYSTNSSSAGSLWVELY